MTVLPVFFDSALTTFITASAFPLAYANYCNDAFIRKAFYEPFLNGDDSFAGNYRTFQEATDSQLKKMLKDWTKISG